jgi:hypothetical protein
MSMYFLRQRDLSISIAIYQILLGSKSKNKLLHTNLFRKKEETGIVATMRK